MRKLQKIYNTILIGLILMFIDLMMIKAHCCADPTTIEIINITTYTKKTFSLFNLTLFGNKNVKNQEFYTLISLLVQESICNNFSFSCIGYKNPYLSNLGLNNYFNHPFLKIKTQKYSNLSLNLLMTHSPLEYNNYLIVDYLLDGKFRKQYFTDSFLVSDCIWPERLYGNFDNQQQLLTKININYKKQFNNSLKKLLIHTLDNNLYKY